MSTKKQSLYEIDAQISEALDALERDSDAIPGAIRVT
jgi:hypothetical protein